MKKNYFILLFVLVFVVTVNSQSIMDDLENYPVGTIHEDPWLSWDGIAGTGDDISVSDEFAASGMKSILVAEGGIIDGVLALGNVNSGTWELDFKMYIPEGKTAYYNLQNSFPEGPAQWNWHCFFNKDGNSQGAIELSLADTANQTPGTVIGTGNYPADSWFDVSFTFYLGDGIMDVTINGANIGTGLVFAGNALGGLNLFSNETFGGSVRYYVDDVTFNEKSLSIEDSYESLFSVYPNPVVNTLSINSKSVVNNVLVYDILGSVVANLSPNIISPTIDMSTLSSGTYLVRVTIGDISKTIKVVK